MMVALAIVMSLAIYSGQSHSGELALGLWTHHFNRDAPPEKCTNEKHDLMAYKFNGGLTMGMYNNSHCITSYLAGYTKDLYRGKSIRLGYSIAAVSGYPDHMHVVDGLIIIPSPHIAYVVGDVGIRVIYIPRLLVGAGFVYEF